MIVILGAVLGAVLGSFALVLADRSLQDKSFLGRSYCPQCRKSLRWYDLLPVLSYLFLKGHCRYCHKVIPKEYLLVEVILGSLIAYLFYSSFRSPLILENQFQLILFLFDLIFKIFFITVLLVVTITDLKKTIIPDRIMFPSIYISLVALLGLTIYKIIYLYYYLNQTPIGKLLLPPKSDYFTRHALIYTQDLLGSLISAVLISGFFWALIIVTKGRGMGGGDVKLGAFMGLGLGFPNGLLATVLAFLTGAIAAIILIVTGKKHFGQHIPFGPFLVLGSLITLFWGNQIMEWYLSLSR